MGKGSGSCTAPAIGLALTAQSPFDELSLAEIEAQQAVQAEKEIADEALRRFAPTFFYTHNRQIKWELLWDRSEREGEYELVVRMLDYLPHLEGSTADQKLKWLKRLCDGEDSAIDDLLEAGASYGFAGFGKKLSWLDNHRPFERSLSFMSTIWHRGHAGRYCSQQWMYRQLNAFYGYGNGSMPKKRIDEWLTIAGFTPSRGVSRWPQQTMGQRIESRRKDDLKPLLGEASFSLTAAFAADEKLVSPEKVSARGEKHEDAHDDACRDLIRQLRDTQDFTRHKVSSDHQEVLERLLPDEALLALSKRIQRRHVNENSLLERKDMELALRAIFEDTLDIEVEPELSETDPVDIKIKKLTGLASGKSRRAAVQVKTHVRHSPELGEDHHSTSLALMNAGSKSSAEEISSKIRKRLNQTDIYMCVDIETDQRPGYFAPVTRYHVNSIKPEVLRSMRRAMKDVGFFSKPDSVEVTGMVETEVGRLGYAFKLYCSRTGAVTIGEIPSNCMERVVSINALAPETCKAITHSRYKNILAGRSPRFIPKRSPRNRARSNAKSSSRPKVAA